MADDNMNPNNGQEPESPFSQAPVQAQEPQPAQTQGVVINQQPAPDQQYAPNQQYAQNPYMPNQQYAQQNQYYNPNPTPGYIPVQNQPVKPTFVVDDLVSGDKAYVIILTIVATLFGNIAAILVPITMWYCWRIVAPLKARKALIWGLVTWAIMFVVMIILAFLFIGLIVAMAGSATSGLGSYSGYGY